jgi:catechol 2,3-dioxygenase-like lactoylglutathione lyase family enzyme
MHVSSILPGVNDMELSGRFYTEGLGWKVQNDYRISVFFVPHGGSLVGFYGRDGLADMVGVSSDGRPVKWLGDGVMVYFRDPGSGVVAALELVDGVASAGLPPAHVGLHAGPVLFQQGDCYGRTVNLASRIAEYARPGEVLVTQEVVDTSAGVDVTFTEIGPVELKGISGLRLHAAHRAEAR